MELLRSPARMFKIEIEKEIYTRRSLEVQISVKSVAINQNKYDQYYNLSFRVKIKVYSYIE